MSTKGKKNMKKQSTDTLLAHLDPSQCVFCQSSVNDEELYGKLIRKHGVTVHYFCMLFSSGLSQGGKSEDSGIFGFMPSDIIKEVRRGTRLRCYFCKKKGATIGCVVGTCRKVFHLGCGKINGTMHQYYDSYSSFCDDHRPRQTMPVSDRLAFYGTANTLCAICMNAVEARSSNDTLRAPCCRNSWFHRVCIEKHARSAGLYFFKCPLCNNKEIFQEEMLQFGVYLPDQDAAWEREPNAYEDLLERYLHCDAPLCTCPNGRDYNRDGGKWEILICDSCGSKGSHVDCHSLIKRGSDYYCGDCSIAFQQFSDRRSRKKTALNKSPHIAKKRLSTEQALEEKNKSEYPGKSDILHKKSLSLAPKKNSAQKVSPGTVLRLSYDETEEDVDVGNVSDVQPSTSQESLVTGQKRKKNTENCSNKKRKLNYDNDYQNTSAALLGHQHIKYKKNKCRSTPSSTITSPVEEESRTPSPRKSALRIERKRELSGKPKCLRSASHLGIVIKERKPRILKKHPSEVDEEHRKCEKKYQDKARNPFSALGYARRKKRRKTLPDPEDNHLSPVKPVYSKSLEAPVESTPKDKMAAVTNTNHVSDLMSLLSKSCPETEQSKRKYHKKGTKDRGFQTSITQWLSSSAKSLGEDKEAENDKNLVNSVKDKLNGKTLILKWKGKTFKFRRTRTETNIKLKNSNNENVLPKELKKPSTKTTQKTPKKRNHGYDIVPKSENDNLFLDSLPDSPVGLSPAKCTRNALLEMKNESPLPSEHRLTPLSNRKTVSSSGKKYFNKLECVPNDHESTRETKCSLEEKFIDSYENNRCDVDVKSESSSSCVIPDCSACSCNADQKNMPVLDEENLPTTADKPPQNDNWDSAESSNNPICTSPGAISISDDSSSLCSSSGNEFGVELVDVQITDDSDDNTDLGSYVVHSFDGSPGFEQHAISVPNN